MVTDRRNAGGDWRIPSADLAALSQAVADRNQAYAQRSKAEADWAAAQAVEVSDEPGEELLRHRGLNGSEHDSPCRHIGFPHLVENIAECMSRVGHRPMRVSHDVNVHERTM